MATLRPPNEATDESVPDVRRRGRVYRYIPKGRPLPEVDRRFVYELTLRGGPKYAAETIGVSRNTISSVIAGLPCYPATQALIRQARLRTVAAA
jgi:hypothetical protein